MKKMIPIIAALTALTACATAGNSGEYRQISSAEAQKMMESESNYIILDVRRADEYASGHIPGAINVANESIVDQEPKELPDKKQLILVYCRSGNRSKQASQKLANMGYTNIVEFGGISEWAGEIVNEVVDDAHD